MTRIEFENLVYAVVAYARRSAPRDSGNLAYSAIKVEFIGENEARIYVDEAIAPYMPYTNEPWVSSWWNGKQNPNLYWWDELAQGVIRLIENYTGSESRQHGRSYNGIGMKKVEKIAKQFQNKTGDYLPEDVWMHSEYITRTKDIAATFAERIKMLGG